MHDLAGLLPAVRPELVRDDGLGGLAIGGENRSRDGRVGVRNRLELARTFESMKARSAAVSPALRS